MLTKEQQSGLGSSTHVHVHYNPTINGGTSASTKDMLDSHDKTLTKSLHPDATDDEQIRRAGKLRAWLT